MKVFYSFGNRKSRPVMVPMAIWGGTKQPTDKKTNLSPRRIEKKPILVG